MKTILLVEDDPFLIDIYSTKLKEEGFKVEVAQNGQEALERLYKENNNILSDENLWPDVVVLDIVLPKIDGWQVLEKIRKDEKIKNLKIIVFTNLAQKEGVEKGVNLGADKYLIKAYFTPSDLVEEIKKILNQ